mgnify:CR=1 FL=1
MAVPTSRIKNFRTLLPNFLFFVKDFQKLDAQVSDLEALSHFENLFEHFDFSVMGEGSRLHAGEPPALHIASD